MADEVLDYAGDRDGLLAHLVSKLRRGGTLQVIGLDLLAVSLVLVTRKIDVTQASLLCHSGRRSASSMEEVSGALEGHGLSIQGRHVQNLFYCVTARRP